MGPYGACEFTEPGQKGWLFANSSLFCGNLYEMRQFQCHGKPAHSNLVAYRASPPVSSKNERSELRASEHSVPVAKAAFGRQDWFHGALSVTQPHLFQISTKIYQK